MTSEGKNYNFKRSQFPLVLSYAITLHSAQGITKDIVIIDYGDSRTGMIIYRKKSMKLFEFEICQSKFYQVIICKLDNVSVCFV